MTGSDPALTARNRRELSQLSVGKTEKWPRTSRRADRVAAVLSRRQPDLTVVLENVHDPHNVSAVLRSCDAVGILDVHAVYSEEERPPAFARTTSASAAKWITVHTHDTLAGCYAALRAQGFAILATAVEDRSVDIYDQDLTQPVAIVFGNEQRGLSPEAINGADTLVRIPMLGMVESLNISVACAVTLYEAMRQRRLAGAYDAPKIPDERRVPMSEEWLKR